MLGRKSGIATLFSVMVLLCFAVTINAQAGTTGTLTSGQPSLADISAGQTLSFEYTVAAPANITLQAIGEAVSPTITILKDGEVVAEEANDGILSIVSLTTFLSQGTYIVEVTALNSGEGTVILVIQDETPVTVQPLPLAIAVSGEVNAETALALFSFDALAEPAYLYVESSLPDVSADVRVVNVTDQHVSGMISADMVGARFRIPASTDAYQIEIVYNELAQTEPFTLCLVAVSQTGCEAGTLPATPVAPEVTLAPVAACTVSSAVGGPVNIRQSASTASTIVGALPVGSSANVLGISPDGLFFNVQFNSIIGWVSLSVVTTAGDCANVGVINPPPIVPQPTLPPTLAPTQPPTQPPAQPTQPPTTAPSATPSGPCLISVVSPVNVYQIPVEQIDYLQDQVGAGGELIPTGRLADNSWWKTNYAGAWIQTARFNNEVTVSGDCSSLPVVTP